MSMRDLNTVYSKRFHTEIHYYPDDTGYYGDDDVMVVWGSGADGRGYYVTFDQGGTHFDDSETELA